VVGLLPLTFGPACLRMTCLPFLVKQAYRCDSVVISSFVRTGYTTRRWVWLLGRIGYSITHHYPLHPIQTKTHCLTFIGIALSRILDILFCCLMDSKVRHLTLFLSVWVPL
jgi:hypothetical protein